MLLLKGPDLLVDLPGGFVIGGPHHVGQGKPLPLHLVLNQDGDIHVLKEHELVPSFPIGLHGFVLIDGLAQAGRDERRRIASWEIFLCPLQTPLFLQL